MIVWADTDDDTEEYVGATLAAVAVGVAGGSTAVEDWAEVEDWAAVEDWGATPTEK